MKKFIVWAILLIAAFLVSVFIHEVGHGFSAYKQGVQVSTGFNKVGDVYKKPSNSDFRANYWDNVIKLQWDIGVLITLILAVVFTILFHKVSNGAVALLVGAFALANAVLRLFPMLHSLSGLFLQGNMFLEDEVVMGLVLYKATGFSILKYLPVVISLGVSCICLVFIYRRFKVAMSDIYRNTALFSISTILVSSLVIKQQVYLIISYELIGYRKLYAIEINTLYHILIDSKFNKDVVQI